MASNLDRYRMELEELSALGGRMLRDLNTRLSKDAPALAPKEVARFESSFQGWYTESAAVVKQLIPDRLAEYRQLYEADQKRKTMDGQTFAIQDWFMGSRAAINKHTGEKYFDDLAATGMRFRLQLDILQSASRRFESSLMDLEQIVRADLFDSEIDVARELLKNRFERASGVVAGVVLEGHLQTVCSRRAVSVKKKNPTISDLNDHLKNANVIDVPVWRFIQRLGDLRNLCGHRKDRDPTAEEVRELIDGVDKIIKTVA